MNNYAIFTTGMMLGGFLGMAALSLVYSRRGLLWHRFHGSAISALLALDRGDAKGAMELLIDGLDEVES